MSLVQVSRQLTDENNNLSWGVVEIDESELEDWETPLTEEEVSETPEVYSQESRYYVEIPPPSEEELPTTE